MDTIVYDFYVVNYNIYVNYNSVKFYQIQFENNNNLIRIGYEKSTEEIDHYLIDVNKKIRQESLYSYPKISVTLNLLKYNKVDITKSYPYHGKNTTILNINDIFVDNINLYPKYFVLNKNNKYIINTIIKFNYKVNESHIKKYILPLIYSQIFHLRINFIQQKYEFDISDYLNSDDNTKFIKYKLGESQFSSDYYGITNKNVKLYNEVEDEDYKDDKNSEEILEEDEDSNENNYLPEIVKLNVNLTNKIFELENKLISIQNNLYTHNNNINYKIVQLDQKYINIKYILSLHFIFFLVLAIFMNY
jgi:hypothetical protein